MKVHIYKLVTFISVALLLMMTGCKSNKIDISGAVQGVWKTGWSEEKPVEDLENMDVTETIAFINDSESGSTGKFRQLFQGTVDYTGDGTERVAFAIVIAGDWSVRDVNDLQLEYDLNNMSTSVSKAGSGSNSSQSAISFLTGDWSESVTISEDNKGAENLSQKVEENSKMLLNTFFRNIFRDMNKEKVSMKNVVIDGKKLNCKSAYLPGDVTYTKLDVNAAELNTHSSESNAQSSNASYDESSVAPVNRGSSAGLPNYDWLSYSYATHNDLAGKSGSQLRIMRNYIYAKHGYIFNSSDLKRFFSQYGWYTPRYRNVDNQLSSIERANVQLISSYE